MELVPLRDLVPDEVARKRAGAYELQIQFAAPSPPANKAANLAAHIRNIIPVLHAVLVPTLNEHT